jgi:hypothetical protein
LQELSFHILDLVENSISAKSTEIKIIICEDEKNDLMVLEIEDNGSGVPAEILSGITDPFVTTRTTREIGLGLTLTKETARDCEGDLTVKSKLKKGTRVRAQLKFNHINRDPLGDIADTIAMLMITNADVNFIYRHVTVHGEFEINSGEIKEVLGGDVPLHNPKVIKFIRFEIGSGLRDIKATLEYKFDEDTELPVSANFLKKSYIVDEPLF